MTGLEPEQRFFLIKNYYHRRESIEYARKTFNTKYGKDSALRHDTVKRFIEKFEATTNTNDERPQSTGRPRVVIGDENILKVEQYFQQNSTTSFRRAASNLNIKCESLRIIARYSANFFSYKI
ncbi:unnamed protein product [Rotaria magnacalcarata]|uniref:DUF4817 domain-containing protein n=1 Tax=Rotaria magnacalcarata TaxID=392030 RepID=A0A815BRP1_9BILA|nr:unnamed protein product [Rotaria magnacalcarata]CAF3806442.1 unnamed protein product [Rotaria magnacalcarata]CAF3830833.1 unnamed protein product [Rotaria magnacalcarata]